MEPDAVETRVVGCLIPQTPGELKQRSERLHSFPRLAAVQETLDRLLERELVVRHPRRPGQKEDRFEQMLGGVGDEEAGEGGGEEAASGGAAPEPAPSPVPDIEGERLDRIERELGELRAEVARLREALGNPS